MRRNAQSGNSFNNKEKTTTNSSSSKQELFVTTTTKDVTSRLAAAPMVVVVCQTKATAIVVAHSQQRRRWGRRQRGQSHHNARARARPRAIADDVVSAPMFGWRPPSGANPLEGALASAAPIEGLGALTGYWFLDVFAAMNVVLIVSLVVVTSKASSRGEGDGDDET